MMQALKNHWRIYLIEAWALGMFMLSASVFAILIEHPDFPVRAAIGNPLLRRMLMGIAMGLTAIALIYSRWGKRSGAHMNPAVTLTFLQMERIRPADALWYILAQFSGGTLAMLLVKAFLFQYISAPEIRYVATTPGIWGPWVAWGAETALAFMLFLAILISSNHSRWAPYTGYIAGFLVALYITFEAPISGMSINPARTVASALPSGIWMAWWIYMTGPVLGMQLAGGFYRRWYRFTHNGNCLTMDCHMSGQAKENVTYEVLGPSELLTNL